MCSICTNAYINPVTLICGHKFCHDCISRTFDVQKNGEYSCPGCMEKFGRRPELKKILRVPKNADHHHSVEPNGDSSEKFCTYCINVPKSAVALCLHCEAFLCVVHKRTHSKSAEHVLDDPNTSLEDRKCPVHQKILEYYCTVDDTCICLHCLTSDHNGHRVTTMSEFLQHRTKTITPILEELSSKEEETQAMLQSLKNHKRNVDERASFITEKVTAILGDVKRQQEDLEKRLLNEISRQEQQISLAVSNHIEQLGNEKLELLEKILQVETLSKNNILLFALENLESLFDGSGDDVDLDRGMGIKKIFDVDDLKEDAVLETLGSELSNIVIGVEKYIQVKDIHKGSPSGDHDDVDTRLRNFTNEMNFVKEVGSGKSVKDIQNVSSPGTHDNITNESVGKVAQAQNEIVTPKPEDVAISSGHKSTTLEMLLDVNTASNYLIISDDLKTVSRSDIYLSRPETPKRFQSPQVLSTRGISSGKHELQLEVNQIEKGSGDSLFIGMSYASMDRRGSQALTGDNNDTWGLWMNDIRYSVIQKSEIKWLSNPFSRRKKIMLDYEGGRLSFYELCEPIKHLYTFTTTFTQPLHLLISVQGNCWVKILVC